MVMIVQWKPKGGDLSLTPGVWTGVDLSKIFGRQPKYRGQWVVITDNMICISQLLVGSCPDCPPESTRLGVVFTQAISIAPLPSPLLIRVAPDAAQILCQIFTPKRHRQLWIKDLPKVPPLISPLTHRYLSLAHSSITSKTFSVLFSRSKSPGIQRIHNNIIRPYRGIFMLVFYAIINVEST